MLFDFDGLIVDTESAYRLAWAPVLRPEHLGKFDEIASGRREEEVAHLMVPFLRTGVSGADHALTLKRLEFARLMADPRFMRPLPGIRELVGKLSPAHRLHVVSNSTCGSVDESLRLLSLREPFERLHCWAPDRRPKPAPDLYEAALESLGLPKSQVVALEDSRTGLGRRNGRAGTRGLRRQRSRGRRVLPGKRSPEVHIGGMPSSPRPDSLDPLGYILPPIGKRGRRIIAGAEELASGQAALQQTAPPSPLATAEISSAKSLFG